MNGHIDATGVLLLMLLGIVAYTFYKNPRLAVAVVAAIAVVAFIATVLMGLK